MSLRFLSYNIHRCYGRDGVYDPGRIRRVLHELDAQVIALQEVELLHDAPGLLDFFCEDSSWKVVQGITLTRDSGHYGNAILTSLPIRSMKEVDLSWSKREPRGALSVTLEHQDQILEVVATHLGLHPAERRSQVKQLLSILEDSESRLDRADLTVLMGDLNEWFLWGRPLRWLRKYFQHSPALASYPACYPLFALDRIWIKPYKKLSHIKVVNNQLTQIASDHLPILASLD